jgi:deoxyribose-phosphate aldolase
MRALENYIDHTILDPFADIAKVEAICQEAITHSFYSVCVSPFHISHVHTLLENTDVNACMVAGFPFGFDPTYSKMSTIKHNLGFYDEVDLVVNLQALSDGNWKYLKKEIVSLTQLLNQNDKVVKWILESGNISRDSLERLCHICLEAEADFVKTSTGYLGTGARTEDVQFMKQIVGDQAGVKASGGIRNKAFALELIDAGASRIGASKSVQIVTEA